MTVFSRRCIIFEPPDEEHANENVTVETVDETDEDDESHEEEEPESEAEDENEFTIESAKGSEVSKIILTS